MDSKATDTALPTGQDRALDLCREIIVENEWEIVLDEDDNLIAEIDTPACDLRFSLNWQEESELLYCTCLYPFKVAPEKRRQMAVFLGFVNSTLWLGHFNIPDENGMVSWRYVLPYRSTPASIEQIEDTIEAGITQAVRFHDALQKVAWTEQSPEDIFKAMSWETLGEA
jgi:hypothetical protein